MRTWRKRVLLADDSPTVQKHTTRMLESVGCEVMVVANGLAAIEAVQQQVFDLVLMDLEMPEMGGLEATRAIRRSCPAHELPIVGVSGSNRAFLAETCTNAGMNSLLAKPLQAELIRAVLGLPQALAETA